MTPQQRIYLSTLLQLPKLEDPEANKAWAEFMATLLDCTDFRDDAKECSLFITRLTTFSPHSMEDARELFLKQWHSAFSA